MGSWTKYLRAHTSSGALAMGQSRVDNSTTGTSAKFSSFLPEVYAGHPSRIQRYSQFEEMNRDSFIRAALDTIAEFCTQSEEASECPFDIVYNDAPSDTESKLLKQFLTEWVEINSFSARMFSIFRNTLLNGDSFYLRDPETGEWSFLDHYSVLMAKVDEENGRKISDYIVKGFDDFRAAKFSTRPADTGSYSANGPVSALYSSPMSTTGASAAGSSFQMAGHDRDSRKQGFSNQTLSEIDANNVIHLSMSDGLDVNWPFGPSILESVYKVWKQKEMVEDAILIYRTVRAPERRVFYIDVGNMNPVQAKAHVENIKNEIHQRRIPNRSGGGTSMIDAAYNPLSILDDYFLAQTSEGRGSKIEVLPGGDATGDIMDLNYFRRELAFGFRIPTTYLPYGDDQTGSTYNDGKVSTVSIQEFMFNRYCMRIQNMLVPEFDKDFKRFVSENGGAIEPRMFRIKFCPPQNFTKYRQIELDNQQVNLMAQVSNMPDVSKRFAKLKYGGWTQDELLENQRMWAEENPSKLRKANGQSVADIDDTTDLSAVGVRGGMGDMGDMGGDMNFGMDKPPMDDNMGGDMGVGDMAETPPPEGE